MGWDASNDESVRAKGIMYFVLHPHGQQMVGRWVGWSYDGLIETGWSAIARTEPAARELIDKMHSHGEWATSDRNL